VVRSVCPYKFLDANHDEIIARRRARVAAPSANEGRTARGILSLIRTPAQARSAEHRPGGGQPLRLHPAGGIRRQTLSPSLHRVWQRAPPVTICHYRPGARVDLARARR